MLHRSAAPECDSGPGWREGKRDPLAAASRGASAILHDEADDESLASIPCILRLVDVLSVLGRVLVEAAADISKSSR